MHRPYKRWVTSGSAGSGQIVWCLTKWSFSVNFASKFLTAFTRGRLKSLTIAVESVLRREQRSDFCSADVLTIAALVDRADYKLFESILHNPHHTSKSNNLMLEETVCSYELRYSRHNRELMNETSRLWLYYPYDL